MVPSLIAQTPQLEAYWREMSMRHSAALSSATLSSAIQGAAHDQEWQVTDTVARTIAHVVLDAGHIAQQSPDPAAAVTEIFKLLHAGWPH